MNNTITSVLFFQIMFLFLVFLVFILFETHMNREYNDHVCSVYGKAPDCITPLR